MDEYKYENDAEALDYNYDEIYCNYCEEDRGEIWDNYD